MSDKAYYAANRERILARQRAYNRTPEGKLKSARNKKKNSITTYRAAEAYRKRYPEKTKAKDKLGDAVRRGLVFKPSACPKCGGDGVIDGHHHDYSKPLEVEFLCRQCHVNHHSRINQCPTI